MRHQHCKWRSKVADGTIALDALLKEGKIGVDTGAKWTDFNTLGKTLVRFSRLADGFNRICCCGGESSAMVKYFAAYPTSGLTPLMTAASNGNTPAVRSLLAAGANPFVQDSNGGTARDWAAVKLGGGPFPLVIADLTKAEENWSGARPAKPKGKGNNAAVTPSGGSAKVSSEL